MTIVKGYVFAFWVEMIYLAALIAMIMRARQGVKIPAIYKVAGLDAMDEAIGRCTEMGRPVHFSPGIGNVQNAQTLAAMSILGYVAKQCARYDTDIIATNRSRGTTDCPFTSTASRPAKPNSANTRIFSTVSFAIPQ